MNTTRLLNDSGPLEHHGTGPIHFAGSGRGLYERHLLFGNVVVADCTELLPQQFDPIEVFLPDSLTDVVTRQLPAVGHGLRYQYGIFKRILEEGWQRERPDNNNINGVTPRRWLLPCKAKYEAKVRFADWLKRASGGSVDSTVDAGINVFFSARVLRLPHREEQASAGCSGNRTVGCERIPLAVQ